MNSKVIDFCVASLPMKYLGLPLGTQLKARNIWDTIIKRKHRDWLARRNCTYQEKGDLN